jgi:hypothetical protein
MTEGLGNALEHIGSQIARGVVEAELELSALRRRCSVLEAEIRSIRDALEAMDDPPPMPSWMPPVTVAAQPEPERRVAPPASSAPWIAPTPATTQPEPSVAPSPATTQRQPRVEPTPAITQDEPRVEPAAATTPTPFEPRVEPGAPSTPSRPAIRPAVVDPAPAATKAGERLHVLADDHEVAVSMPVPAPGTAEVATQGREGAVDGATDDDDETEPPDDDTRFASYMPMLEELWAIARSDDAEDVRGRPTT